MVDFNFEVLALPNAFDAFVPQLVETRADRPTLRIQNGLFKRNVDYCPHSFIVSLLPNAEGGKDAVKDFLNRCLPSNGVNKFKRGIEVEQ